MQSKEQPQYRMGQSGRMHEGIYLFLRADRQISCYTIYLIVHLLRPRYATDSATEQSDGMQNPVRKRYWQLVVAMNSVDSGVVYDLFHGRKEISAKTQSR